MRGDNSRRMRVTLTLEMEARSKNRKGVEYNV